MKKQRYRWWRFIRRVIRDYPALKEEYEELHRQSLSADTSGMPKGSAAGRTVESIALRELPPDDGLKDYGIIRRKASLLTAEPVRRYVDILDRYKLDAWWWLATPYSTPKHGNSSWIKCVSPAGRIYDFSCNYDCGVRPFCILNSNIFVSK